MAKIEGIDDQNFSEEMKERLRKLHREHQKKVERIKEESGKANGGSIKKAAGGVGKIRHQQTTKSGAPLSKAEFKKKRI